VLERQRRIALAVRAGAELDEIEVAIIDPAPVDEEQKAALWLYAEALEERRRESMLADCELTPIAG
jgi:hypothetical protein